LTGDKEMYNDYAITVEKDELKIGHFKVVIKDSYGVLFATPVRNVTKNTAYNMIAPLMFSFEAGVRAAEHSHMNIYTRIDQK
jgi:hypothetical protein